MKDLFGLIILILIVMAVYRAGKRTGSRKGYGVGYSRGRRAGKSCFVASAAFQDPHHPCVRILRRYRDDVLQQTIFGRLFIDIYDIAGPYAATVVERRPWLRKAARRLLVASAWSARRRLPPAKK